MFTHCPQSVCLSVCLSAMVAFVREKSPTVLLIELELILHKIYKYISLLNEQKLVQCSMKINDCCSNIDYKQLMLVQELTISTKFLTRKLFNKKKDLRFEKKLV